METLQEQLARLIEMQTATNKRIAGLETANATTLTGHEGPVWQVSWAHPKFGALLASCSFIHCLGAASGTIGTSSFNCFWHRPCFRFFENAIWAWSCFSMDGHKVMLCTGH